MNLSFLPDDMDWSCAACKQQMEPGMVELQYLENVFKVELPVCPQCGAVYIPEDLAIGRMLEVEQLLEDK
jgi:NAD-dependent SIR2 family protein deacetylase